MINLQTKTHVCLITDYCSGGELFLLLDRQPAKVLREDAVRYIILPCKESMHVYQNFGVWRQTLLIKAKGRFENNPQDFIFILVKPKLSIVFVYFPSSTVTYASLFSFYWNNVLDNNRFYAAEVVVALEYLHCQGRFLFITQHDGNNC